MSYLTNPFRFGGGGPGGTHRYWEVLALGTHNGHVTLAEIELAATVGGPDLTTGTSVSGVAYGTAPAPTNVGNVIDNNISTVSTNNVSNGMGSCDAGWRIDFSVPTTIGALRLRVGNSAGNPANGPSSFYVRGSDDATVWITYLVVLGFAWTTTSQIEEWALGPALPTTGRANAIAWRVFVEVNDGGSQIVFSELVFRDAVGGTRLNALAGGGVADSTPAGAAFQSRGRGALWSSVNPEKACDNLTSSGNHAALRTATDQWLGFAWPTPTDIGEVGIAPEFNYVTRAPRDFRVEYTTDFSTWTAVGTFTGQTGWANNTYKWFAVP